MKQGIYNKLILFWVMLGIIFSPLGIYNTAHATLRSSPTWYDVNTVGVTPDWHYRVPIVTPSTTTVNSTVSVDVDFNALLTTLGVSGTFDANSPRIIRPNGTIVTIQEFNQTIYGGVTDSTANRGNIRFISQDAGSQTYYLYFDITQNGTKPVNPQTPINGTFEQGAGYANGATIPGWNAPTLGNSVFDAQVRPSETVTVTSDGTASTGQSMTKTTDGTSYIGGYTYLMGARSNNEPNGTNTGALITKTITVPATNPGNLVFRYRIEGWDSNVNGNTTQYDYFLAKITSGSTTTNLVGPALNNYTTYPFSPNYGTSQASTTTYGYGQYNSFDMSTQGTHRLGMTITKGSEPWFTITQSLSAFAGQTITLTFSTFHTNLYRTWVSVANVEWSLVTATLGTPQAFGVQTTYPTASTAILAGTVMKITAQVDAMPSTYVTAAVFDGSGNQVATNIRLYNDGTHGSSAATPYLWTNDGSDSANPTYTIPLTAQTSTTWLVRAYATDGSSSTLGVTNGLIHQSGAATSPTNAANYFNIGENNFQITGLASFTNLKTVSIIKDPVNGTTNPKAIPGGEALYEIIITNTGGGTADNNSITVTDPIPANTSMYVGDLGTSGSGPIIFTDGATSSGLTYSFVSLGNASSSLKFSNNSGSTWTYVPTPDANGYDANVTNIKVTMTGTMNTSNSTNNPSFSIKFKVKIQ